MLLLIKKDAVDELMAKAHVKGFTRKDGAYVAEHDDSRSAAPDFGTNHKALAASSKKGDYDHDAHQEAAAVMKTGDHAAMKSVISRADTAQREHILDHIHPDHWEGLGAKPINKERSVKEYNQKFGKK